MTAQSFPLGAFSNHSGKGEEMQIRTAIDNSFLPLSPSPPPPFCVTLLPMGSKDKGKKEVKKAPKPKPKPEPGRKREGFTPAPPK